MVKLDFRASFPPQSKAELDKRELKPAILFSDGGNIWFSFLQVDDVRISRVGSYPTLA